MPWPPPNSSRPRWPPTSHPRIGWATSVAEAATGRLARFAHQSFDDGHAAGQQYQGKGQAGGYRHGLQGHQATAEQQGNGQYPFENGPEHPLTDRRVDLATGGDGVDHQRSRVGGGDEEHDDQHHTDEGGNG